MIQTTTNIMDAITNTNNHSTTVHQEEDWKRKKGYGKLFGGGAVALVMLLFMTNFFAGGHHYVRSSTNPHVRNFFGNIVVSSGSMNGKSNSHPTVITQEDVDSDCEVYIEACKKDESCSSLMTEMFENCDISRSPNAPKLCFYKAVDIMYSDLEDYLDQNTKYDLINCFHSASAAEESKN